VSKWLLIAGAVPVVGLAGFGGITLMRGTQSNATTPATALPSDAPEENTAPEPAPSEAPSEQELARAMVQRAASASTLTEAYAAVAMLMGETLNDVSPGAMALAMWADARGNGADFILPQDETSSKMVRKDIDLARGKRMCVRGFIVEIERQKGTTNPVYAGLLMAEGRDAHHFFAVGSTGELVAQSRARFCGVVTGIYSFANVSGGQTQSIQMVGMFDLPENRMAAR